MEYKDDPVITTAAGYAIPRTTWALVRNGVIASLVRTYDAEASPFEGVPLASIGAVTLTGDVAMRVASDHSAVGYLVDERGNITPAEGRTRALLPGECAYHAASGYQPGTEAITQPPTENAESEPPPELPKPDKPAE